MRISDWSSDVCSSDLGAEVLKVEPAALERLAAEAFADVNHLLRPGHLAQLRKILDDPEASDNDRFVALDLLKNRSEARRVGIECVRTCRSRCSPYHSKKKKDRKHTRKSCKRKNH